MVSGSEEASEGLVMGIESFSILHHLSISTTLSLLRYLLPNVSDLHIYTYTHIGWLEWGTNCVTNERGKRKVNEEWFEFDKFIYLEISKTFVFLFINGCKRFLEDEEMKSFYSAYVFHNGYMEMYIAYDLIIKWLINVSISLRND